MKLNLTCCLFILENNTNSDIRKNDVLNLYVLVDKKNNSLFRIKYDGKSEMKDTLRDKLNDIVGFRDISLEQVYTLAEPTFMSDGCDTVYVGMMNKENIKKIDDRYELRRIVIKDNSYIILGEDKYSFKTVLKKKRYGLEYIHEIKTDDINIKKMLMELIITFKYIRSRLDFTDIIFKFMPSYFALEDVRTLYELLKDTTVDKSNFRKRIMKYCKRSTKQIDNRGYRPTYLYTFEPLESDIWI